MEEEYNARSKLSHENSAHLQLRKEKFSKHICSERKKKRIYKKLNENKKKWEFVLETPTNLIESEITVK